MLKTTRLSETALKKLGANDNEVVGGGSKANNKNLFKKLENAKSRI